MKKCSKCGGSRFNNCDRCMDCRNDRAKVRSQRLKINGGKHTAREWKALLARTSMCPDCKLPWDKIEKRADSRYQNVWTKDHIVPVVAGGTDDIANLRPLCYRCNFKRHIKSIPIPKGIKSMRKIKYTVTRGSSTGVTLKPHLHADGCFVVSPSRFKKDYVRLPVEDELFGYMAKGFSVRMSNPEFKNTSAPSLIAPNSLEIYEQ